jgi:hypothetical protein
MLRKWKVGILTIVAVTVIASTVWVTSGPEPISVELPTGTKLTLIDVTYGTTVQTTPVGTPLKRAWLKVALNLPDRLRKVFVNTTKFSTVRTPADTAVFWFRETPPQDSQATIPWVAIIEEQANSRRLLSGSTTKIRLHDPAGWIGIICSHCPTNNPKLHLSFCKMDSAQPLSEDNPDRSHSTSISLKNPAYRK